jgi:hypothetical protein
MSRTNLDTWEDRQSQKGKALKPGNVTGDVAFVTKLGAAKHQLSIVTELPDIAELIDHAEAVRAAAQKLHVSAEGINAWTRFVIDAERKAAGRIEAMRSAGELAAHGGDRKSSRKLRDLKDLIHHRPQERALEWGLLAKLTEFQLNEMERIANEEDRILSRHELLKLAKAGTPVPSKEPKSRSEKELQIIAQAHEDYPDDNHQFDDEKAKIAYTDRGAWVGCWVWVEDRLARSDLDEEDKPLANQGEQPNGKDSSAE